VGRVLREGQGQLYKGEVGGVNGKGYQKGEKGEKERGSVCRVGPPGRTGAASGGGIYKRKVLKGGGGAVLEKERSCCREGGERGARKRRGAAKWMTGRGWGHLKKTAGGVWVLVVVICEGNQRRLSPPLASL
jgi:hypothetical protein